jgi:hypothetical protein
VSVYLAVNPLISLCQKLHNAYAEDMLRVILLLRGFYIKLGS